MQSVSIKFNYKGEFRRLALTQSYLTIAELAEKASRVFSLKNDAFYFSWIDEDGDSVKFNSDEELQEALCHFKKTGTSVFKFEIETSQSSHQQQYSSRQINQSVHKYVTCDECGMKPIKGIRYKCAVREDFDLCESCEAMKAQPHPMLKIYHPDQSPSAFGFRRSEGRSCPRKPNCGRSRGPFHGLFSEVPGCGNRTEKWARCAKVFVDAIDEASKSVRTAAEMKPSDSSASSDNADIEQRIMEDVIRLSIEESSTDGNHTLSQSPSDVRMADASETNNKMSTSAKPYEAKVEIEAEAGKKFPSPLPQRANVTVTAVPVSVGDISSNSGLKVAAMDIWYRVYEAELKALNEMGFYDVDAIIPLLREHVKTPASNSSKPGDAAASEAMQRVVLALLGQTMTTHRP